MSLANISQQLQQVGRGNKIPPVELWNPDYCGEINLTITQDGTWLYEGTPFKRLSLIKLFASVLKKENNDYFLVTPVEKIKIQVEDAPFILTNWHWVPSEHTGLENPVMEVVTNMEDSFYLNSEHPLTIKNDNFYIEVRRGLLAKVHRNVYYQWIELAKERECEQGTVLYFTSGDTELVLGTIR